MSTQYDFAVPRPMRPRSLMQLRETKALRVLDHHQVCIRNVHAYFDHRGRHQHVQLAALEAPHDDFFVIASSRPCSRPTRRSGKIFLLQLSMHLHRRFDLGGFVLLITG